MRLLVLGGTKFLGRAAVEAALADGHEVTLFNRGETLPELFPDAEKLRGDRDGDLSALEGREWDAVIDPSGYVPRVVRASAELLQGSVGHYLFVSSASVYAEPYEPGFDETAPTVALEDPASEEILRDYGGLKAACELVVAEVFPGAHTNVRAGLIVGPNDRSGRFTYWPLRISLGGEVLAPAPQERLVQFIDVRDLGAWLVEACERGASGAFNASGRAGQFARCSRPAATRRSPGSTTTSCSTRAWAIHRVAALDPRARCELPSDERREGCAAGLQLPAARGDRARHAGLGARSRRASWSRPRQPAGARRSRPGPRSGATGGLARGLGLAGVVAVVCDRQAPEQVAQRLELARREVLCRNGCESPRRASSTLPAASRDHRP